MHHPNGSYPPLSPRIFVEKKVVACWGFSIIRLTFYLAGTITRHPFLRNQSTEQNEDEDSTQDPCLDSKSINLSLGHKCDQKKKIRTQSSQVRYQTKSLKKGCGEGGIVNWSQSNKTNPYSKNTSSNCYPNSNSPKLVICLATCPHKGHWKNKLPLHITLFQQSPENRKARRVIYSITKKYLLAASEGGYNWVHPDAKDNKMLCVFTFTRSSSWRHRNSTFSCTVRLLGGWGMASFRWWSCWR